MCTPETAWVEGNDLGISGHAWKLPEAKLLDEQAVGAGAILVFHDGVERSPSLPFLIASDGAIEHMKIDGRRLRPNIVISEVLDLAERHWPDSNCDSAECDGS